MEGKEKEGKRDGKESRRSTGTVPRRKQLRTGGNRKDLKKKKKDDGEGEVSEHFRG